MEAPLEDSFCHHLANGAPSLANDVPADAIYGVLPAARAFRVGSFAGVVLRLRDGTAVGTVCAFHPERGAYGDRVLGLLEAFGTLLGRDIAHQRRGADLEHVLCDLRRQAATDPLTGVANRRAFHTALERAFRRPRAGDAVAIVDIDRFKEINDAHGHLAGDRVLTGIAAVLEEAADHRDTVGRLGGDEFTAVLTGGDPERWRRRTEAGITRLARRLGHPVTLSIGVAALDAAASPQDALARADEALYAAKRGALVAA